jgi:hypothetical protein
MESSLASPECKFGSKNEHVPKLKQKVTDVVPDSIARSFVTINGKRRGDGREACGCRVREACGYTVREACGYTVREACGCTVREACGYTVREACGYTKMLT